MHVVIGKGNDTSYLHIRGRNSPQAGLSSLERRRLLTEVALRVKISDHLGVTPRDLILNSLELLLDIIPPLILLLDMSVDGVVQLVNVEGHTVNLSCEVVWVPP